MRLNESQREEKSCVMLLARQIAMSLNEEKKRQGLTANIWQCTGEEACLRGSWSSNNGRQEQGTCSGLGTGWGIFLSLFFFSSFLLLLSLGLLRSDRAPCFFKGAAAVE